MSNTTKKPLNIDAIRSLLPWLLPDITPTDVGPDLAFQVDTRITIDTSPEVTQVVVELSRNDKTLAFMFQRGEYILLPINEICDHKNDVIRVSIQLLHKITDKRTTLIITDVSVTDILTAFTEMEPVLAIDATSTPAFIKGKIGVPRVSLRTHLLTHTG